MAAHHQKVVRLESVSPGGNIQIKHPGSQTEVVRHGLQSATSVLSLASQSDLQSEDGEARDEVYPLPDGWPRIPQLFQKRSWNFSTAVSPSVNKATSHLELLQTIIEEWSRDTVSRLSQSANTRTHTAASQASSFAIRQKREMRFGSGSVNRDTISRALMKSVLTTSTADRSTETPSLSVMGIGAAADDDRHVSLMTPLSEAETEIPYLGAEEVVDEVITLLAKLERDRQDTLDTLHSERDRVSMLGGKIDSLAARRITELPLSVQKEHEACAMDIAELNWHVNYKGRAETRMSNRKDVAETLNTKLKADIEFVNKHIPLVREKLDLEQEAMDRIEQAQMDTNDELDVTTDRCYKVECKSNEAIAKTEAERSLIKRDLESVNNDLTTISEELSKAKMTHNTYIHQCTDYRQQLQDNEQELKVMEVKEENSKVAESMQAIKVRDLQSGIVKAEFEHRRLADDKSRLDSELNSMQSTQESFEKELNSAITRTEEKLRKLNLSNQELDMELEDTEQKLNNCKKQKQADEKNLERMKRELERTENQCHATQEDLALVTILNSAVHDQLQNEEERCIQAEEALRSTCDTLKRQVKEEIHSRTVLSARITSDSSEIDKLEKENKMQMQKVLKKNEEVQAAVKSVEDKVKRLRAAHSQRKEEVARLEEGLSRVAKEKSDTQLWRDKTYTELKPVHDDVTENLTKLTKQIEHMDWKSEMMYKKMEDMGNSDKMMSRAVENTQKTIDILQSQQEELEMRIEAQQALEDNQRLILNETTSRIKRQSAQHKERLGERSGSLKETEKQLEENLRLNKELAATYRRLQQDHVAQKNKMLDCYDQRVSMEATLKDLKQLSGLQHRLHSALSEYYRLRGLYHRAEIVDMSQTTNTNAKQVGELQDNMDDALETIAGFLQNQMDADAVRKMAMDKVEREEAAERQSQPVLTVHTPKPPSGPPPGRPVRQGSRQISLTDGIKSVAAH